MNDHLDVLELVVERLERAGIPYMLTGSLALSFYAEPRFTRDVDIVVELSAGEAPKVVNLFALDFYVDAEAIASAVAREGMVNLIHSTTIVKIDLIVRKSTPHHVGEFERRRRATVGGSELWIVTPEDLLISKLLWLQQGGSAVHRRDIASLRGAGISMDDEYLRQAMARLGLRRCGARYRVTDEHTDTPPHVTRLQRELFQQVTGGERLRMACAMFDTARALVLASLPEAIGADPSARRAALLRRFHGRELGPDRVEAILAHWRDHPPPGDESLT